jgi:hypothetical protein
MAREPDNVASRFETEHMGGLLSGFWAEERVFDRSALWRVGAWGAASVAAVVLALFANQSSLGSRHEEVAAANLARQSQQIQSMARESQTEIRRLTSAIETLNGDRDRLYSRITVLEQGLDSATGAIARQAAAATTVPQVATISLGPAEAQSRPQSTPPAPIAAPMVVNTTSPRKERPVPELPAPDLIAKSTSPNPQETKAASLTPQEMTSAPALTASVPVVISKPLMPLPDPAAPKSNEPTNLDTDAPSELVASVPAQVEPAPETVQVTSPMLGVVRTEFGIEVGGANSVGGLRALWLGLLKSRSNAPLKTLRPIIVIKEANNGLGMQLRLVAGPFDDAAAAAKACAVLVENGRPCETTLFEGQRLTLPADDPKPAAAKPASSRRSSAQPPKPVEEPKKPPETSSLSSLFGRR